MIAIVKIKMERKESVKILLAGTAGTACALYMPAEYRTSHGFKKSKHKCKWNCGGPCEGKVWKVPMFGGRRPCCVCTSHLTTHRYVMSLNKAGYDIDKLVEMEPEELEGLALGIKLVSWDKV